MPRPKHVDRPVEVKVNLPHSVYDKTQSVLYSELEGRVPYGAMSKLMTGLLTTWLANHGIEL